MPKIRSNKSYLTQLVIGFIFVSILGISHIMYFHASMVGSSSEIQKRNDFDHHYYYSDSSSKHHQQNKETIKEVVITTRNTINILNNTIRRKITQQTAKPITKLKKVTTATTTATIPTNKSNNNNNTSAATTKTIQRSAKPITKVTKLKAIQTETIGSNNNNHNNNTSAPSNSTNGPITIKITTLSKGWKKDDGTVLAMDFVEHNTTVESSISKYQTQQNNQGNTTNTTTIITNVTNTTNATTSHDRHVNPIPPPSPPTTMTDLKKTPYRDMKTKLHAQKCLQNKHGGVYIKHFRKASGSSLYQVIRDDICPTKTIHSYASEFPYFNTDTFTSLNTTVFITALRHPIDRIESLYWFEGRWPRTCHISCEAKKVKDNTTAVADLNEWIEHVHDQTNYTKLQLIRHGPCGIWQSVDNYYIRTLLGIDIPQNSTEMRSTVFKNHYRNKTITRDHLEEAKRILDSFDLILIQDQIRTNSKMIQMMYTITGSKDPTKTALPEKRKGIERENLYFPMLNSTYQRLVDLNSYDIELYNYAVELSAKQVREWDERNTKIEKDKDTKEEIEGNFFNVTESCRIPPKSLSMELTRITMGGKYCSNKPWMAYLGGRNTCIQHSNEPMEKLFRDKRNKNRST